MGIWWWYTIPVLDMRRIYFCLSCQWHPSGGLEQTFWFEKGTLFSVILHRLSQTDIDRWVVMISENEVESNEYVNWGGFRCKLFGSLTSLGHATRAILTPRVSCRNCFRARRQERAATGTGTGYIIPAGPLMRNLRQKYLLPVLL